MKSSLCKEIGYIIVLGFLISNLFVVYTTEKANAGSYNGEDLALAILANQSTLLSSSYTDEDSSGHSQGIVLSSKGLMNPTDGSTFALLSSGAAGADIVSTNEEEPGDERGTWFAGGKKGYPRDMATLTLDLKVPAYMHYLYYDVQFFSAEYPEYVGSQYNDKITITVESPSEGSSTYSIDVNSGDFVLTSNDLDGTGFDIFARSGYPGGVDLIDTTPRSPGADAGATALVTRQHVVSPHEEITVTFEMKDTGDNLFDSAAFIDNLMFSGFAKTEIMARKTAQDLNGEPLESGDTIRYTTTISNIGTADQDNNNGHEFIDYIPVKTTFVDDSESATSGSIDFESGDNRIVWDGEIPGQSSVAITFDVIVDLDTSNGDIISNQGFVYWDSDEDGTNDATELTDNPAIDDGIDQDNDGETGDDDPTNLTVTAFEPPESVTEDFTDDMAGGIATQSYLGRDWFETSNGITGNNFEVVSGYRYSTSKAFKTQLRSTGGNEFWNYTFSELQSNMTWWEIWFACGNASEASNLYLDFKNINDNTIARLKFEYTQMGTQTSTDWVLELHYWDPAFGWCKLNTDYAGGYLCNDWYHLKIAKNGLDIDYTLNRTGVGMVDFKTGGQLGVPFYDLASIEMYNTLNPVVCPMFFWDEHTVGFS